MNETPGYTFDISTKFQFWNKDHWSNFRYLEKKFKGKDSLRFMEIGSCEGYTATKICDYILTGKNCKLDCVDPDPVDLFHKNMVKHKDKYYFHKEYSIEYLTRVYSDTPKFDFIYIDGDHNSVGIIEDAVLSWKVLKIGGILLIDDYGMKIRDPWFYGCHKEFKNTPNLMFIHPMVAISSFLTIYRGCYKLIRHNYQVMIEKVADLTGKNLNCGDLSKY